MGNLIYTLLTVHETSRHLRVSTKTLYRWVYEKKIPYLKIGGKLLFDQEKIEAFIAASEIASSFQTETRWDKTPRQSSESHRSRKGSLA